MQKASRPPHETRAVLVFPPQWSPRHPHYALTSLGGHLRSLGYQVELVDLNVEFYDHVLTPDYLKSARNRLLLQRRYLYPQAVLTTLLDNPPVERQLEGLKCMAIDRYLNDYGELLKHLPDKILDAVESLRDPRRFYNPEFLTEAMFIIDRALELVSLPYYPADLGLGCFTQPDCLLTIASLREITASQQRNLFYDFMRRAVPRLLQGNPHHIGISINAFSQVVPGLTLARMLRQAAPPECHVGVGGNFFYRVAEVLEQRCEFFDTFCHSLVCGEGEAPMAALMDQLRYSEPDFSRVPNLLYQDSGGTIHRSAAAPSFSMNQAGVQDMAGLPLEKYLAPEPVLCIRASKGCYWARCTFCDTFYGVQAEQRDLDHLVKEIRHLRDTYGVRHFQFIDDCIAPRRMAAMAQRFLDEELGIEWFCNGRLDKGFHQEILALAHRAGLRMVLWGLESGSARILEAINKGTPCNDRFEVLRRGAAAGLWNFAYIFFGFPTETREEAMMTIQTLIDNRDIIHSYGRSVFTLGRHSELYRSREHYGILSVVEDIEELSTNLHYRTREGMDDQEIDEMMKLCTTACSEAWGQSLWFFLRYRENIHLYLSRFGLSYVDQTRLGRCDNFVGAW